MLLPLAVIGALLLAGPAAAKREAPSPGAAGIGDRLFPTLGNGGYDARHYHLDLTYPTADAQTVDGKVTMVARARHVYGHRVRQPTRHRDRRRRGVRFPGRRGRLGLHRSMTAGPGLCRGYGRRLCVLVELCD